MTSQRQIEANRSNAKLGGVKTAEGKAVVKYNALKHGLLAKEAVITTGDGAEDPQEFNTLVEGLKTHYNPKGTIEEMLVEKIAVSYWRLRRACRYEAGLIKKALDTYQRDNLFKYKKNLIGERVGEKFDLVNQLKKDLKEHEDLLAEYEKDQKKILLAIKKGTPLNAFYDEEKYSYLWWEISEQIEENHNTEEDKTALSDYFDEMKPEEIHKEAMERFGYTDQGILQEFSKCLKTLIDYEKEKVEVTKFELDKVLFTLERKPQLNAIPGENELNRLLRYETAIEKQFYKALNELERIQRMKRGELVPPPVNLDVSVN